MKEDLMKVRYKVLADYPDSPSTVGDIIQLPNEKYKFSPNEYCDEAYFDTWPDIFERLPFWKDIKEEDLKNLPEYIQINPEIEPWPCVVYKVAKWELNENNLICTTLKGEQISNSLNLYIPSNIKDFKNWLKDWKKYTTTD